MFLRVLLFVVSTFAWDGPNALVISLRSAKEKREHISLVFKACDIPFEFVDAFEAKGGKLLHAADQRRIEEAGLGGLLEGTMAENSYSDGDQPDLGDERGFKTDGELAIALSHAYVLYKIGSGAAGCVLVCEDDVVPLVSGVVVGSKDAGQIAVWQETVKSVIQAMPATWEVYYFGWCLEHCDKVQGLSPHVIEAQRPLCTHGE
jgi:hypothetical protein